MKTKLEGQKVQIFNKYVEFMGYLDSLQSVMEIKCFSLHMIQIQNITLINLTENKNEMRVQFKL